MTEILQASLVGGELSPSLHGHVDLARYQQSLKTCKNWIVNPYGGLQNRSGFAYVAQCYGSGAVRLIPFAFNVDQQYMLEVGAHYIRLHVEGAPVASGGVPVTISTPYPASAISKLKVAQSADVMTFVHPDYPVYELKRLSHTSWTFTAKTMAQGPFRTTNTDKSIYLRASSAVGTGITLTASGTTSFFGSHNVGMCLRLEQYSATYAWEPGKRVAAGDIRRANGRYYRAAVTGTTGQNIPATDSGRWMDGGVSWDYINDGYGICRITSVTSPTVAVADVLIELPPECVMTETEEYGASIAVDSVSRVSLILPWTELTTTAGHGLVADAGGILEVQDSTGKVHAIRAVVGSPSKVWLVYPYSDYVASGLSFVSYTAPTYMATAGHTYADIRMPSYKWAWEAFGDYASGGPGYPSAVTYYQQRMVFSGTYTQPDTVWMSQTGNWSNFNVVEPVLDSSPMSFTLGSTQVNGIQSLLQLSDLMALTSGAVWAVGNGSADVLTPSSIGARLQSYVGASSLEALGVLSSALFVSHQGQSIREITYRYEYGNFTTTDLTVFARHLFEGKSVVSWAYQSTPRPIVWAVRDDGILLACSYVKEQEVVAWHQHETEGDFESVAVISEQGEDYLYAVVKRGSPRFVERLASRQTTDDVSTWHFADCGITQTFGSPVTTVSGLSWLNGREVSVLADGGVVNGLTVSSGTIVLPHSASIVTVGLPYTCDIETLPVAPPQSGAYLVKTKIVKLVELLVRKSRSFFVGKTEEKLTRAKIRPVPVSDPIPGLYDGVVTVYLERGWGDDTSFLVRHTDPTPVEILALVPEVILGE